MENEKSSRQLFKGILSKLPPLQFGKSKTPLPAKVPEGGQTSGKVRKRRSKVIPLLGLIVLLGLVKVFRLDDRLWNWFDEYQQQFQQPAPEPIESGTVCHLLMELEEQESVLLQPHEDQALDQLDTMVLHGLSLDSIDAVVGKATEKAARAKGIDLNELVYFEALTQDRARLMFADGSTAIHDLSAVLQLIRDRDKCHFFQAVGFEGQAYEYFNILYTESFEKVNCEGGPFYRARLNISESDDLAIRGLLDCGTDLFSAYIYNKTRRRLEFLNPNSDYSYRREVSLSGCQCEMEEAIAIGG